MLAAAARADAPAPCNRFVIARACGGFAAVPGFRHVPCGRISSMFLYRAEVLLLLTRHGIRPTEETRPELVRDYVRDLYKYEIRCLRERYVAGEFPKREYAGRVDALRRRYLVLSLKAREFLVPEAAD